MDSVIDYARTSWRYRSMNVWRQMLLQPSARSTLLACSVTWPAIRITIIALIGPGHALFKSFGVIERRDIKIKRYVTVFKGGGFHTDRFKHGNVCLKNIS